MSSRVADLNLFPAVEEADDGSDATGSLGSLSARSRNPGPDDTLRFGDLLNAPSTACRVIMDRRGTKRVCARALGLILEVTLVRKSQKMKEIRVQKIDLTIPGICESEF